MDDEYAQLTRQRQLRVKQFTANPNNIASNSRAKSAFNEQGVIVSAKAGSLISGRRSVGLRKNNLPNSSNNSFEKSFVRAQQSRPSNRRMESWYDVGRNELTSGEDETNSEIELSSIDNSSSRLVIPPREFNRYSMPAYEMDPHTIHFLSQVGVDPDVIFNILQLTPPPSIFLTLKKPVEKAACIYIRYLHGVWKFCSTATVFQQFLNRFYQEFYNNKCLQLDDTNAFKKVCERARHDYNESMKRNAEALAAKQMNRREEQFSRDESNQDDCLSDRPDADQESSVDSIVKEPKFYSEPHAPVRFAVGGGIVRVNLEASICTVLIEDVKNFCKDRQSLEQIEMLEGFKGPYLPGFTQTKVPLLFVERQIERFRHSQLFQANSSSGDANDCLLIWKLLELLIRQQGKVTGRDLAELLVSNTSLHTPKASYFTKVASSNRSNRSSDHEDDDFNHLRSMDQLTSYLLLGHVEEAVKSAIRNKLFFEALFIANRMFKDDPKKLGDFERELLAYWKPQPHPTMTLIQVASGVPIQLPVNQEDSGWWRPHIAVLLANLNTSVAMQVVYQIGVELAKKEYNSAADFCFLAINLLTGQDCFIPSQALEGDNPNLKGRTHISLIKASLPDDYLSSTDTHFGWSIVDYQATEIYDYAVGLANPQKGTPLHNSVYFQYCRFQYAQLLSHFGGFSSAVAQYCTAIAGTIWQYADKLDKQMLLDLCELALRMKFISGRPIDEFEWTETLRSFILPTHHQRLQETPVTPIASTKETIPIPTQIEVPQIKMHSTEIHEKRIVNKLSDKSASNMIIPDDNSNFDETTSKWIGAEDVYVTQPPPMIARPLNDPPLITNSNNELTPMHNHLPQSQVETIPSTTNLANMVPVAASPFMPPTEGSARKQKIPLSELPQPLSDLPQQQQQQQLSSIQQKKTTENKGPAQTSQKQQTNEGWLGTFKKKIISKLPDKSAPSMILPNDNPIFDETTGKWIGAEDEYVPPPPPLIARPLNDPQSMTNSNNGSPPNNLPQEQAETTLTTINLANMAPVAAPPLMPTESSARKQKPRYATAWDQPQAS